MSTMKSRLRARLEALGAPELAGAGLRELVIDAALAELERPTPYMLDRGHQTRQDGGGLEDVWAEMVRTAAEGG